ncbi:MAG: prephenate dehydratase [Lachnospiraceae bacterium]|nr:prephenate dehydratase [Lachnospiraceae bacterium]
MNTSISKVSDIPTSGVIACQGTVGAYSQIAARRLFPDGTFIYFKNFDAVARAVREGMCDFGVLPIENNTFGSVKQVYQLLGRQDISIVRSYKLKIEHQLLAKPGTALKDITSVRSHEQALGQCEQFLHSLGDKVAQIPCLNTAVAARTVAESDDPYCAAISSPECAALYGLEVVKKKIADSNHNYTRFLCIAKKPLLYPGASRISLILSLPHVPGSLAAVLDRFSASGINLLKLESTPIPGRDFEFSFYIDIEGSVEDPRVEQILDDLRNTCPEFRFLGCYLEEVPE